MHDVSLLGVGLADDDDTVLAGQVGAGVGYAVTEQIGLSLDYRFFITENPEFDSLAVEADYRNHSLWAGVKYRF